MSRQPRNVNLIYSVPDKWATTKYDIVHIFTTNIGNKQIDY